MTGYLKTAVLVLFFFLVPVGFILLVSPPLFKNAFISPDLAQLSGVGLKRKNPRIVYQEDRELETSYASKERWYAIVRNASDLDPHKGDVFLVSFLVRFNGFPSERKRHNIIEKYDTSKRPYPGWAIGIKKINGLIRPQVYWRDAKGHGGWYTFDSLKPKKNTWYSLTLIARDSKYLSLYIEPLEHESIAPETKLVSFLGGHKIENILTPSSKSDLSLGVVRSEGKSFRGDLARVVIGHPSSLVEKIYFLLEFLEGGSGLLKTKLDSRDLVLAINERWQDESQGKHPIERT